MTIRPLPRGPHRPAFTLVELIVVVLVVGALGTLAFPVYERVVQGSRATACVSHLSQLGAGLNLYLGEHNMTMPTMKAARADRREDVPVLDTTLSTQITDARIFACPADNQGIAAKTGTSYFWNSVLNGQNMATLNFLMVTDITHIVVLADKDQFHPYEPSHVNLLYADGHATHDFFSTMNAR